MAEEYEIYLSPVRQNVRRHLSHLNARKYYILVEKTSMSHAEFLRNL